jgi:cytochrome c oxidase subunit I
MSLGAIFAIFAGWYYWFPKMTGYMYSEALGKLHFWLTFIGANVLFFPQHFLGLAGMPRRIADYPDGFAYWNGWSSLGAYITAAGTLVFVLGALEAYFIRRQPASDNPWVLVRRRWSGACRHLRPSTASTACQAFAKRRGSAAVRRPDIPC